MKPQSAPSLLPLEIQEEFVKELRKKFEIVIHTSSLSGSPVECKIDASFNGERMPLTIRMEGASVVEAAREAIERIEVKLNNINKAA